MRAAPCRPAGRHWRQRRNRDSDSDRAGQWQVHAAPLTPASHRGIPFKCVHLKQQPSGTSKCLVPTSLAMTASGIHAPRHPGCHIERDAPETPLALAQLSSNKDGGVEAKAVIPRTTELANSLRSCRAGYRVAGDCSSVNAARQLKWALFHHSVLSRLLSAARSQTSAARAPATDSASCSERVREPMGGYAGQGKRAFTWAALWCAG